MGAAQRRRSRRLRPRTSAARRLPARTTGLTTLSEHHGVDAGGRPHHAKAPERTPGAAHHPAKRSHGWLGAACRLPQRASRAHIQSTVRPHQEFNDRSTLLERSSVSVASAPRQGSVPSETEEQIRERYPKGAGHSDSCIPPRGDGASLRASSLSPMHARGHVWRWSQGIGLAGTRAESPRNVPSPGPFDAARSGSEKRPAVAAPSLERFY